MWKKEVEDEQKNVNILNGVYYMCANRAHINKMCDAITLEQIEKMNKISRIISK